MPAENPAQIGKGMVSHRRTASILYFVQQGVDVRTFDVAYLVLAELRINQLFERRVPFGRRAELVARRIGESHVTVVIAFHAAFADQEVRAYGFQRGLC